jgi:hypothetical protein
VREGGIYLEFLYFLYSAEEARPAMEEGCRVIR